MSDGGVFEDTVKICRFYSGVDLPIEVDYDGHCIHLGEYAIDPLTEDGELVTYIVSPPTGYTQITNDLDEYFQRVLKGEGCSDGL